MGLRNVCVRRLQAHPVNQLSFSVHRATKSIAIMTLRIWLEDDRFAREQEAALLSKKGKTRQSMLGFFFPIIFSMKFSSIHRIADVGWWWWLLIFFSGTLNSFIRVTNLCIGERNALATSFVFSELVCSLAFSRGSQRWVEETFSRAF